MTYDITQVILRLPVEGGAYKNGATLREHYINSPPAVTHTTTSFHCPCEVGNNCEKQWCFSPLS